MTVLGLERNDTREGTMLGLFVLTDAHQKRHRFRTSTQPCPHRGLVSGLQGVKCSSARSYTGEGRGVQTPQGPVWILVKNLQGYSLLKVAHSLLHTQCCAVGRGRGRGKAQLCEGAQCITVGPWGWLFFYHGNAFSSAQVKKGGLWEGRQKGSQKKAWPLKHGEQGKLKHGVWRNIVVFYRISSFSNDCGNSFSLLFVLPWYWEEE